MLFFKFTGRKIRIEVEKEVTSWEMESDHWSKPDVIAREVRHMCESKLNEAIEEHIEMKIQNGLIDQLADKVIAQFNLNEMYETALKAKVKEIMFQPRPRDQY